MARLFYLLYYAGNIIPQLLARNQVRPCKLIAWLSYGT